MKIENKKKERVGVIVAHKIWSFRGFHALTGMLYGILLTLSYLNISPKEDRDDITGFWDKSVLAIRIAFGREKTEAIEIVEMMDVEESLEKIVSEGPSNVLLGDDADLFQDVFEDNSLSGLGSRVERSREILKKLFEVGELERVLSPQQLANLIYVESTGRNGLVGDKQLGEDPNLWAYGILQIRKCYVDDVNKFCGTELYAYDCKDDPELSILITQAYMNRYAQKKFLKKEPSFQDMARIHNGGPNGWKTSSTNKYWAKVIDSKDKTEKVFAEYKNVLKEVNS